MKSWDVDGRWPRFPTSIERALEKERADFLAHQRIEQDHVRILDSLEGPQRQKVGGARARANQQYAASFAMLHCGFLRRRFQ
jgi:hypothetical protein